MAVFEKIYFKAWINKQYICLKIIFHSYILNQGEPNYVEIFPVGMILIFTDFPTGIGF